ncbi:MAG: YqaA family protein [Terriglobales bacterium]
MSFHSGWLAGFFYFFLRRGGLGLLLLGVLDSSFMTLPFANDVAVIILSSLHHERILWYAGMAALGSVAGCYVMYWVGRKGGESFLQTRMSAQTFKKMRERTAQRGPILLALPGLIPPPFPFSAWVLAAGALDVPRERFLVTLGGVRLLRFLAEGMLAFWVGRRVVFWLQTPNFQHFIQVLMGLAFLGSAYSIVTLVRSTRKHRRRKRA